MEQKYDFQKAKLTMDYILKGLRPYIDFDKITGVKVPLNFPLLINKGNNSLVFSIPETTLVAKSSFYDIVPKEKDPDNKGYFHLAGYVSGLKANGLENTVQSLNEMGFDKEEKIYFPEMQEFDCKVSLWDTRRIYYTIMPDLRENNKFQVSDAENFSFDSIPNGKELKELYNASCEKILKAYLSGQYKLMCAGHGSEEKPEPAIRHMFLVQHNDDYARLVIADLNHLVIQKK